MRILGLNISGYLSSAALVDGGGIVAAACEERFSRIKRDRAFPAGAIRDALRRAGWEPGDLDAVAVGWNPGRNLGRDFGLLSESNRLRAGYLTYVPNAMAGVLGGPPGDRTEQAVLGRRIVYVDHHLAHAASAAFTSPWEHGAVVTIDAFGEEDALTIGTFRGNRIDVLEHVRFPHSPGSFYSYFTEFLGFRGDADEYKVMALGAFADPDQVRRLRDRVDRLYRVEVVDGRLRFELDLARFDHYLFHRAHDFGPLAEALGMEPRRAEEPVEARHFALAGAVQGAFEAIVTATLRHARQVTGEPRVALAGGCFMNSVANGRLEGPGAAFDEVHVPPYPDDSGVSIGAALHVALDGTDTSRREYRHNFFGPAVGRDDAEETLRRCKVPYRRLADPAATIAACVAAGEIVGVATGAMEFGQRALGHRSILADPRDPEARDKVNRNVKRREWFRPYAASVLADRVGDVFDVPPGFRAWFMEKVRAVRPDWASRIPGILHADGSVRLHTVDAATNPELHAILAAFDRLTGVPLVLDTSFNVAEMPVVCDAEDALGCFFVSGIDTLVLHDLCVRKAGLADLPGGGAP